MFHGTKKEKVKETEALAPRRPFEMVSRLERDMERMFDEFWRRPFFNLWGSDRFWPSRAASFYTPPLDVYEERDDLVIKAELPGLSKEDLDVNLSGSTLTIKGEKSKREEVKEENYHCCERSHGSFTRSVDLPVEVKADQIKASFKDGILEVRLPKTEEAKRKLTKVKID